MSDQEKHIEVHISGRTYPLKINAAEEERMKNVVVYINGKVSEVRAAYPHKDGQDYLAMALLTITNELKMLESSSSDKAINNRLSTIENSIQELLD